MRLNAKAAKELRKAAGYRNQTATPSKPEFPGVARFYAHPVYETRPCITSSYERRGGQMVKVFKKGTAMNVIARKGQTPTIPMVMSPQRYPLTELDAAGNERPHPRAGEVYMGPQLEQIPVTKPVHVTGPKKTYRVLKRLNAAGLLNEPHAFDEFILPGVSA